MTRRSMNMSRVSAATVALYLCLGKVASSPRLQSPKQFRSPLPSIGLQLRRKQRRGGRRLSPSAHMAMDTAGRFTQKMQKDALRFAEADKDGNNALDWDEFLDMQPSRIRECHSDDEIRKWFQEADVDGNGTVSINEFFLWSLQRQTLSSTEGLRAIFAEYDTDGSGEVDLREFQRIADDLGFGAAANEIFIDLDDDQSGRIRYEEVIQRLMPPPKDTSGASGGEADDEYGESPDDVPVAERSSPTTKKFLMAIAWSAVDLDPSAPSAERNDHVRINAASWTVDAEDAETLCEQIRTGCLESGASVADLIEIFNFDGDGGASLGQRDYYDVTEKEFLRTLRERCLYTGPLRAIREAFAMLGGADDGKIDMDEFFEFVQGRRNPNSMNDLAPGAYISRNLLHATCT